ncbi:MAG: hypothetical protein OXC07_13110 [Kistimonas sp.]|nr:hypothetical protein [Kistimonas sp.]
MYKVCKQSLDISSPPSGINTALVAQFMQAVILTPLSGTKITHTTMIDKNTGAQASTDWTTKAIYMCTVWGLLRILSRRDRRLLPSIFISRMPAKLDCGVFQTSCSHHWGEPSEEATTTLPQWDSHLHGNGRESSNDRGERGSNRGRR